MKYTDYRERREQGTFNFPIAYYHQTPNSPRYFMPYHWHTQYEIIHIISGTFHMIIDNEPYEFHPGDVLFITDGVLHGGTPVDCIYDCIVFDLHMLLHSNHACSLWLKRILEHDINVNILISGKENSILFLANNLADSLADNKSGKEFMIQGYLYQLIGIILEKNLFTSKAENSPKNERLDSIKKVLEYISNNYMNEITLENLADIAGMNPKYFCRYFRSMTERTPIDYLNYYRSECAGEMLLSPTKPSVKDVAFSCGFTDESYFIKTFRRYKGLTPKQFSKR